MKLLSYSFSENNGMTGGGTSVSVTYTEDGRCLFQGRFKAFHNQPTVEKNYYAEGLLDKIRAVCLQYQLLPWTDLPRSDVFVCDGPGFCCNLLFDDGSLISFGSENRIPMNLAEALREIRTLLDESETYGIPAKIKTNGRNFTANGGITDSAVLSMMKYQEQQILPQDPETGTGEASESEAWFPFCEACGTPFGDRQKFCSACGNPRRKRENRKSQS